MLLSRHNLECEVSSNDENERSWATVLCVTNEGVITTDGVRMMFTPVPDESVAQNFPEIDGFNAESVLKDGEMVLLPAKIARQLLRALPRKAKSPWVANVAVDVEAAKKKGSVPVAVVTDSGPSVVQAKKPNADFPDWRKVVPPKDKLLLRYCVTAKFLKEMLDHVGGGKRIGDVVIEIYAGNNEKITAELREAVKDACETFPMRLVAIGDGDRATGTWGLMMPCRAPEGYDRKAEPEKEVSK